MAKAEDNPVRKGRILLIGTPAPGVHLKNWLKSKEIYANESLGQPRNAMA